LGKNKIFGVLVFVSRKARFVKATKEHKCKEIKDLTVFKHIYFF